MKQKFFRKVLKNGMTVFLEKRSVPVVSVAIAVRNGGVNEDLNEKGISHFIEHMLYKGTKKRSAKQISSDIEKNGGHLNGLTDEDLTMYYCKMPSRHINVALDVLGDIIKNSKFDENELEKERKVILEEMKMYKDRPNAYVFDRIQNLMFDGTLGLDLIGTKETLDNVDRKKMVDKFGKIYTPNNLILGVVGDAEFDKIVEYAEKNFGKKEGKVPSFKIVEKNGEVIEKRKGLDQANMVFAIHTPKYNEKNSYAAKVLAALMGGGMSSRLFTEIREKRNLAYSIGARIHVSRDYSYMVIYAGTSKENVGKVKKLILEEFEKVSEELSEEELESIKEQIVGNHQISMEESENQLFSLVSHEVISNSEDFYSFEKKIRDVKLEDVKELAKLKEHSMFALIPE